MLIIGSRALQFHFPDYKSEVKDWDFIGTENEIVNWLKEAKKKDNGIFYDFVEYVNLKLYYAKINDIDYEFYVSKENSSDQHYLKIDNDKEGLVNYASVEVLYSILGSFIHRNEVNKKHILDYNFLKNILKKDNLEYITNKRILETDIRFDSLK